MALVDSPATAPTEPTHPRTALVLLLGILAGALAGTILVLLRRRQD
ncbi:GNVR domain-containing protein [Escherichia coli]